MDSQEYRILGMGESIRPDDEWENHLLSDWTTVDPAIVGSTPIGVFINGVGIGKLRFRRKVGE